MTAYADIQMLEGMSLVDLFELDATILGVGFLRFHGYTRVGTIWWQGLEYSPWPIQAEGFARTSDKPPSPVFSLANLDGSIAALCLSYADLVGSTFTRRRTLGKYLDGANFPGGTPGTPPTYGAELVTNNTFAVLTPWVQQSGTVTSTGTVMRAMRAGGATGRGRYALTGLTIGATYVLTFDRTLGTGATSANVYIAISATTTVGYIAADIGGVTVAGQTLTFVATQATHYIMMESGGTVNGHYTDYDNVYCKQQTSPGTAPTSGNPTADPTQHLPDEIWFVERKTNEDNQQVSFELASAMDFNGIMLPRRQIIANQCPWKYRSAECGYAGGPVAKVDDTPTTDSLLDDCGKRVNSCKLRFGENGQLNHGGFPAAGLLRT